MSENQKRILQMLAEGKISVEEATRLLSLIKEPGASGVAEETGVKSVRPNPKFLYVRVEPKEGNQTKHDECHHHEKVNIRIPMGLIRAGIKLKALIPPHTIDDINRGFKEKGINFDFRDLKDEYLEELVAALGESEINVDSEEAEIRIHAE